MADPIHLVVEQGPDKGLRLTVPPAGLRVGRAPKNDVVLKDPLLSRHHCRFFFKPDDGLWVIDLGSANQTLVNGKPIVDTPIRPGDRITIGDTALKVIEDGREPAAAAAAAAPAAGPRADLDLGLASSRQPAAAQRGRKGPLILMAVLLMALCAGVALVFLPKPTGNSRPRPPSGPSTRTLEVDYESVVARSNSIFRYRLQITRDRTIAIDIDDTANTHVHKDGKVKEDLILSLADFILASRFLDLDENYAGVQTDTLEQRDISVTIDRQTHRARVMNRVEPEDFAKVREKLEDFGRVELGLRSLQYSPEKLQEMARDAFLNGKKLYEEREIAYGNLASAIKSFNEAELYLETVDPKPDFYAEILTARKDCQQELEQRFNNEDFLAERAIKLKAWEEAARALRVILDMIPDRDDPRNVESRKKLLEVENRLKKPR